jgi:hypothetical protein
MTDITWYERITNLTKALGRDPTHEELLEIAEIHQTTPEEVEALRKTAFRMTWRCVHGELDYERCPECLRQPTARRHSP